MTRDPVTALTIITAVLLIVSLPPAVVAGAVILLLLGVLVVAIWGDLRPLWNADAPRVEDTTPTKGQES